MKLRTALLFAGLVAAGVTQAQTVITVSGGNLNTYDATSPGAAFSSVPISGLVAGDAIVGIDVRPATSAIVVVADGAAADRLYTLNPLSGQATLLSTLDTALSGAFFGVDFNPTVDRLRVVSDTGQNLRINVDTGAVTVDGPLNGATTSIQASGYTNSFSGATATMLFGINSATDRLYQQNPANAGTQVDIGALGVDTTSAMDIDVLTNNGNATNTTYAGLNVGGRTTLYTVSLTTGAATLVGQVGSGAAIQGFAVRAGAPGGAGASGVPVFGTKGLILLGLLLGAFAVVVLRQSR